MSVCLQHGRGSLGQLAEGEADAAGAALERFAFRKLSERAGPVLLAYGRRLGFTMSGFLALLGGAKTVN